MFISIQVFRSSVSLNSELINANFLFIDAISSSDPTISTKTQLKKIKDLNNLIQSCNTLISTPKEYYFVVPGGDGMCLGFLQGVDLPLKLAIELSKKIQEYNRGKIPTDLIQVRMGLNYGNCFPFPDFGGNQLFWGSGIIISKRIMDLCREGQILVSQKMAEELRELSDEYVKILKPLRDYDLKHGITMLVYSAHGPGFGNPLAPTKQEYQKSHMSLELKRIQDSMLYPKISIHLQLIDPKSMLVHYKQTYEILNTSDKPIEFLRHGIGTDVEKESINDLNLKVYETPEKEMKISSINLDQPYCKEFSTLLTTPIKKNDTGRGYTLEYDIEEPKQFYENSFLVNCKKFIITFSYPDDGAITPKLFEINKESDEKIISSANSKDVIENSLITKTWEFDDVYKGQTIRLEW